MKQYEADPVNWEGEGINSGDEAIALLMGLKPEPWLRYYTFLRKYSGLSDWADLPSVDQAQKPFIDEYGEFLRIAFSSISGFALFERFEGIQSRAEWQGDFKVYAQSLYDNGVLFKDDIVENLGLSYSPSSWANEFYRDWVEKHAWTFSEALDLFNGMEFFDLRQCNSGVNQSDLEELIERHIRAGEFEHLSGSYFLPKSIVVWLM